MEAARGKLAQYHRDLMNKRFEAARANPRTVTFMDHVYPVIAELGGGAEGDVYLVKKGDEFVTIKTFGFRGQASTHQGYSTIS